MCQKATVRGSLAGVLLAFASVCSSWAQTRVDAGIAGITEWRRIGNSAVDLGLASLATGPVARVWYSSAGDRLYAATASGRVFATTDFEQWTAVPDTPVPPLSSPPASALPEPGAQLREVVAQPGRRFAFRRQAWRSDDNGLHWTNLTAWRGSSVVGADIADLAASPRDPDEITVAAGTGVWRSMDAGASWTGLNQFLPNLPEFRILSTPAGTRGIRISLTAAARDLEWRPGEKNAWMPLAQ